MEKNFKLVIEYDGTAYHGWQRQSSVPTIQATIEAAIAKMTNQVVVLHGSGRTDRGVHAWNQVASCLVDTHLSCEALQKGLNCLTPTDIVVKHCESVPLNFHPRFHAISKIYEYVIVNQSVPIAVGRQYAWYLHKPLEIGLMEKGAAVLKGTHDFAAFESTGSPRTHTVRTVIDLSVRHDSSSGRVMVTVEADGFLRCMVRNIVGTLVNVGFGKTSIDELKDILLSKDRKRAGATAPAHGLFLREVKY